MLKENLNEVLRKHPFVGNLDDKYLQILVGCAKNLTIIRRAIIFATKGRRLTCSSLSEAEESHWKFTRATKGKGGFRRSAPVKCSAGRG